MNPDQQLIRGRGRGRALATNRGAASSASAPREPGLPPINRLTLASSSSSSSGPASGTTSTSDSTSVRGLGSRIRSSSPGHRGSHRGFRHEPPRMTRKPDLVIKQGKLGSKIDLRSNYVVLESAPSYTMYSYRVNITPFIDNLRLRNAIVRRMLKEMELAHIYVGGDLYSTKKVETVTVQIPDAKDESQVYQVTLENTGSVESGDYAYVHVYNQLLRKFMYQMGLTEMGRNFFDTKNPIEIREHKLTLLPGYVTSIRNHESQVLLCIETTNKIIRQDTVLETIEETKARDSNNYRRAVDDLLTGAVVLTVYNNKTYSIAGMDWSLTPAHTFTYRNETITLADYYKMKYKLEITDMKQPLLWAKLSKKDQHRFQKGSDELQEKTLLVPELCKMTGLSDAMRANFTLMKALATHLHCSPQVRVENMKAFMKRMTDVPEIAEELKRWELGFSKDLVKVSGRVLPKQAIVFNNANDPDPGSEKADWTMAFRSKKMSTVVKPNTWSIIVPQRDAGEIDNFLRTLDKVGRPLGFDMPKPHAIIKVPNASSAAYTKGIEEACKTKNDLLFVVLATNKPDLYGSVKQKLTGQHGIVSQCFLAKNLKSKGLMSIATKVVIQMNAKLGGEPWTLKWPMKNLMVIGLDVYHGTKLTSGKNVAAMVASISSTHARYFSTVSLYDTTDELGRAVTADLLKCLDSYKQFNNNTLPDRILFFRDGVGDGQLPQLIEIELDQVKSALKTMYNEAKLDEPKFTYVVVSKKINTRLFTADPKEAKNPMPGTVVDDVVTLPERYDFYLIPQAARQGAVSPSAYNVIHDTNNLDPDKIQLLTFKFCHMYFNWSGTVAVPAPCQYAHKLANLIGVAVGKEANSKLAFNLHYL